MGGNCDQLHFSTFWVGLYLRLLVASVLPHIVEITLMSTAATPTPVPSKPRRKWKKITATVLLCLFVLWGGLTTYVWHAMHKTPEEFGRVMMHMPWEIFLVVPFETLWMRARAGTVQIGDQAPDFSLTKLDKTGTIRLSDLNRTEPVVMIFGSYT